MPPVEGAPHEHLEAGAGAPAGLLGQWQDDAVERDRIVPAHHARLFVTEDLVQIEIADRHPRRFWIPRGVAEGRVVLRHDDVPQIGIRGREGRNARHAQLVDQCSTCSRHRRIVGAVTPRISAARNQCSSPLSARIITSCTRIARSHSDSGYPIRPPRLAGVAVRD
jgi:hypothetical protein